MNIKKIGVSALAGSLMAFSANALELSVSGGASLTFSDYGADTTNNAWSMGDGLTFSASGETDGGLTITTSHVIDGAPGMDDFSMSIGTESAGTIGFAGLGGSSALGAVDDVMPTAYEEPWFGVTSPTKVDGNGANNMFTYTSPTVGGATLTATYSQADSTDINSQTSWAIAFSPEAVDGLTVGYAVQEDDGLATVVDDMTMYVKYVYGSITAGYQKSEGDSTTDSADVETEGYGISYAVSDEISVSYGSHTAETPNNSTDKDQEASVVSASYVSGGMTIKASVGSVDNVGGTDATDRDTYEISMSFAF
tara:strand:+ start:31 stop:957 length:927 start_codon:yes stop_codon:yes gene_type:complete